jgi:S1-C subfamily serine protease
MNRLGLRPGGIKSQIGLNEMLLGGDIILEVVGIEVSEENYQKIQGWLNHMKRGDMITVKVLRAGRTLQLSATWDR